jgi:N-acyl-D-amino-acid deacylase
MSLVLTNGVVVDGTGTPPRRADVLVDGGLVQAVGSIDAPAAEVRDVSGAVVCPGFIDIHTHSDLTVLSGPQALSKVHQGVTTEVVGNCGLGVAPLPDGADHAAIRAAVSYLDLDPAVEWTWRDVTGYLDTVAAVRPSLNIATLTGHLPLRAGVVGFDDRPATAGELARMVDLLEASFAAGSVGLSTGLVYAPLCYARDAELLALARAAAVHDRVFAWHVRDYADELLPSVAQALDIARQTGGRVQISHLTAVGRRNWGTVLRALELVDVARAEGVDAGVDIYPYLYGNAPLAQLLPAWAQEGGSDAMARRLRDDDVRARIRSGWQGRAVGWDEITVSWVPPGSRAESLVGQAVTSDDQALDLLAEHTTQVLMIAGGRSEDDLRAVLAHPAAVVASDGLCLDPYGVTGAGAPHPRSYGCFPRYLARYRGDDGDGGDDLAAAVARCTSAPARVAGLDRGVLRPGGAADLVVFDPDRIADTATITEPQTYPDGIDLVMVGGQIVIDGGTHTGRRPGKAIRTRR